MTLQSQTNDSRLRFRLRTLIPTVAVVAFMIVSGRNLYDWYSSTPLADTVASFNAQTRHDSVGKHEPAITEEEIVAAVDSQLPKLDATDQVKKIYARIARSRRLPRDAHWDSTTGYRSGGQRYTVWWINLNVMAGPKSGYGLRIRETDNPIAIGLSVSLIRRPYPDFGPAITLRLIHQTV